MIRSLTVFIWLRVFIVWAEPGWATLIVKREATSCRRGLVYQWLPPSMTLALENREILRDHVNLMIRNSALTSLHRRRGHFRVDGSVAKTVMHICFCWKMQLLFLTLSVAGIFSHTVWWTSRLEKACFFFLVCTYWGIPLVPQSQACGLIFQGMELGGMGKEEGTRTRKAGAIGVLFSAIFLRALFSHSFFG